MKKALSIIAIVVVIVAAAVFLALKDSKPTETNNLFSVPQGNQLLSNMQKAGLPPLGAEGNALHIHQHLDITVNGQAIAVPPELGVGTTFISPLHTHGADGILHVESPEIKDFMLGQFFDQWGIGLTDSCLGNYCADDSNKLLVAVNGEIISNPREHILKSHDQIHILYGAKTMEPQLIKEYAFAPGQ